MFTICLFAVGGCVDIYRGLKARLDERTRLLRGALDVPALPGDLRAKIKVELAK